MALSTVLKDSLGDSFLSGIAGLINTGYSIYSNKRDFDYQKALQQQIFEREDTAVQRRMNDLEVAGLNPNLAAGSAAGAGSAVGRSSTPGVNFGAALDTLQALNQLKIQKAELKYINEQKFGQQLKNEFDSWNYELSNKWNKYLIMNENRLSDYFKYNFDNLKNSAEILQKQNNWFNTNQVFDAIGSTTGALGDIGGLFRPKFYKGKYQR